jgi:hypothetical protein
LGAWTGRVLLSDENAGVRQPESEGDRFRRELIVVACAYLWIVVLGVSRAGREMAIDAP